METTLTEQRKTALELNEKIIFTAQLAQKNLYDMCVMLKQMRDEKLYRELGHATFEEYCENEVGMKWRNAYNYISIVEKIPSQNLQSIAKIGMTKLSLLSSLSESQQEEIQQTVNLEETSVRELKAEIDKLKAANKKAESNLKSLQTELENEKKSNEELMSLRFEKESAEMQLKRTKEELASANERITDLENRPIEVAVQEDEEGKKAKILVKELEHKLSETKFSHANALETQKQQYQSQINELEEQLEQAKNKPAETIMVSSDKETFKAYYLPAVNAFENMLKFISGCSEKDFYIEKTKNLLEICREKLGEIKCLN